MRCGEGYEPDRTVILQCVRTVEGTSWDSTPPSCSQCTKDYFLNGSVCVPCNLAECPAGFFRGPCMAPSGGLCYPCSSLIPSNAEFVAGGYPSYLDNCKWKCKKGYFLDTTYGLDCVPNVTVGIDINVIRSQTGESSSYGPAVLEFVLTEEPKDFVTVFFRYSSSQLQQPQPGSLTFQKSSWNTAQKVILSCWTCMTPHSPFLTDLGAGFRRHCLRGAPLQQGNHRGLQQ